MLYNMAWHYSLIFASSARGIDICCKFITTTSDDVKLPNDARRPVSTVRCADIALSAGHFDALGLYTISAADAADGAGFIFF